MKVWGAPRFRSGKNHAQRGFSLVELLVTAALIVTLYVLLGSSCSGSHQRRMRAKCRANMEHVFVAMRMYASDFGEKFPVVTSAATSETPLSLLIPQYTTITKVFICPGSSDDALPEAESFAKRKISYAYYMGLTFTNAGMALLSDDQLNTKSKKLGEPLFSADGSNPGDNHHKFGGNVLFVDGSTKSSKTNAAMDLIFTSPIKLLNPKP
jgi:prepilin-type N-terminal cleavage/methylation domain-containing protein/prepilin-type processing-associated H-X9-DG protein